MYTISSEPFKHRNKFLLVFFVQYIPFSITINPHIWLASFHLLQISVLPSFIFLVAPNKFISFRNAPHLHNQ